MSELNFKGKEFVYNHHLSVPFRPLVTHPEKGIAEPSPSRLSCRTTRGRWIASSSTRPTTPATRAGATTTT